MSDVTERANRLMALRAHPGFQEAWQISKQLSDEAGRISITYPGWDPTQIIILKSRAQAALEFHEQLFGRIAGAIRDGIEEQAAASNLHDKTPAEVLEQGVYVRQQVLSRFEDLDTETRIPGTYAPVVSENF